MNRLRKPPYESRCTLRMRRLVLTILPLLISTPVVWGETHTVNSSSDASDAFAGDGLCATAQAECTLRAAVEEANGNFGTDTIHLPSGNYILREGQLEVLESLVLSGDGATDTMISGTRRDRVLTVAAGAVTISGVTVRRGRGTSTGGGIVNHGSLTLADVAVVDNAVVTDPSGFAFGGGIYNTGSLILQNVRIIRNRAGGRRTSTAQGGGLWNSGTLLASGTTIERNRARGAPAAPGGGVFNVGMIELSDVIIRRNRSVSRDAGGSGGGGIYAPGNGSLARVALVGNRAGVGGGIFSLANLEMTNVTIARNGARQFTGGLYFTGPTATLTNVTLTDNRVRFPVATPSQASNLYVAPTSEVTLQNSIISGRSPVPDCGGSPPFTIQSAGHNIEDSTSCGFLSVGDHQSTDPMLGPLRDNGGGTLTSALLAGSPAIDAGNIVACPPTDQRGVSRPQGAACDVGAYESEP